ncbi:hypothetical protein VTJ04DRAFT_10017 [Mycothermus thermophilus]|uniref:uncharacterized protein n=1 Tax=Humicola insolens TaxID=85995 RepID=UPI0037420235
MAGPDVVYGEGSYAYDLFNLLFNSVEYPLVDPPIDPDLQASSPTATNTVSWTRQTKGSPVFFSPNYTQTRPPLLGNHPASQSQINHSSPIDSPSCDPVHSPHTETESQFDSYPMTPPEPTMPSPSQRSLSLEPAVQAMHFTHMGPVFVNPVDVNTMDFPETEDMFSQSPYVPYGLPSSQVLAQQSQGAVPAFSTEINSLNETESQYPSLPVDNEPSALKRPVDDGNDSDDSYQPRKRQRTGRQGRGRGAQGASPSARRTKAARSGRDLYSSTHSANGALACNICHQTFKSKSEVEAHIKKQHRRLFNCVFDFAGCEATFSTKNEWKRHVMTQHLLLYYWVCTEGACASQHQQQQQPSTPSSSCLSTPNGAIFNRKDLFTQHLKRMHAPKEAKDQPKSQDGDTELDTDNNSPAVQAIRKQWDARVKELQESCKRPRCALPEIMRCPVRGCTHAPFRGQEAWNLRMEHVAKAHMESPTAAVDPQPSKRVVFGGDDDPTLVEWASHPSVAIIEPAPPGLGRKWTLKTQLQRGPGGNVVVTAPTVNEPTSPMLDSREAIVVAVDEDADADADADEV